MEEKFYDSPELTPARLKSLMQRRDEPAMMRFSIQFFLLLTGAIAVVLTNEGPAWVFWPALVLYGVMTTAMFAALHETAHNSAFATQSLNKIAATLAAYMIVYTPTSFRQFHFQHHRHTHDPQKDPEITLGGKPVRPYHDILPGYLVFLSGIPLLLFKYMMQFAAAMGPHLPLWKVFWYYVPQHKQTQLQVEGILSVGLTSLQLVAGILWLPGLLWLFLGQVIGHALVAWYVSAEHAGCAHEGEIVERTRTTRTNPFARFIMWNMSYHAEHHSYPGVPFHQLPQLHEAMKGELIHTANGYPRHHASMMAKSLSKT